jgi:ADP-ribosyltransferase exoenzyme
MALMSLCKKNTYIDTGHFPDLEKHYNPNHLNENHINSLADYLTLSENLNNLLRKRPKIYSEKFLKRTNNWDVPITKTSYELNLMKDKVIYSRKIHHLDNALNQYKVPKPLTVYRSIPEHVISKYEFDKTYRELSYTSTTLHEPVLKTLDTYEPHTLHIHIPGDCHGMYMVPFIDKIDKYQDPLESYGNMIRFRKEHEFLLPRHIYLNIIKHHIDENKIHTVHARIVEI